MMKKLICRPLSDRKTGSDIMIRMNMTNTSVKIYRTKKLNNGSRVTGSAI